MYQLRCVISESRARIHTVTPFRQDQLILKISLQSHPPISQNLILQPLITK